MLFDLHVGIGIAALVDLALSLLRPSVRYGELANWLIGETRFEVP